MNPLSRYVQQSLASQKASAVHRTSQPLFEVGLVRFDGMSDLRPFGHPVSRCNQAQPTSPIHFSSEQRL